MLTWIVLLVFGVPLYVYIRKIQAEKKARENRLDEIRHRLTKKKAEEVEKKWERIKSKNKH